MLRVTAWVVRSLVSGALAAASVPAAACSVSAPRDASGKIVEEVFAHRYKAVVVGPATLQVLSQSGVGAKVQIDALQVKVLASETQQPVAGEELAIAWRKTLGSCQISGGAMTLSMFPLGTEINVYARQLPYAVRAEKSKAQPQVKPK